MSLHSLFEPEEAVKRHFQNAFSEKARERGLRSVCVGTRTGIRTPVAALKGLSLLRVF
jgi:hypothetical protein